VREPSGWGSEVIDRNGVPEVIRTPDLRIPGEGDHDSEPMAITVPK